MIFVVRKLRRVRDWDVLEPSPISGSFLCVIEVDSEGYEVADNLAAQLVVPKQLAEEFWESHARPSLLRRVFDPVEDEPRTEEWSGYPYYGHDLYQGPFLVARRSNVVRKVCITHDPLALTGLHVEFAELKTHQDIERFASRYGTLGYGYRVGDSNQSRVDYDVKRMYGESVQFWLHHVGYVRLIRNLWPLIAEENDIALRPYITRSASRPFSRQAYAEFGGPLTVIHETFKLHDIGDTLDQIYAYEDFDDGTPSEIGYHAIGNLIQYEIRQATRLSLMPGDPSFYIIVTDLLGAIYWHLSRELNGLSANVRLCHHCNTLIQDARVDAKYCSAACRQKAFQLKKKQDQKS